MLATAFSIHMKYTYDSWRAEEEHLCHDLPFSAFLMKLIPLKAGTAIWGCINNQTLPEFLREPIYRAYTWMTGAKLEDTKHFNNLKVYETLNEFFIRELREDARPFAKDVDLVAPTDGYVIGLGRVSSFPDVIPAPSSLGKNSILDLNSPERSPFALMPNVMIKHVKDFQFPLWQFLGEPLITTPTSSSSNGGTMKMLNIGEDDANLRPILAMAEGPGGSVPPADSTGIWRYLSSFWPTAKQTESSVKYSSVLPKKGPSHLYYISIYLAPRDYHRFHAPCDWEMIKIRRIHGETFPVAPLVLSWIHAIYMLNERVPCIGTWKYGNFSLTAVGATNVASIWIHGDSKPIDAAAKIINDEKKKSWMEVFTSGYNVQPWKPAVTTTSVTPTKIKVGEEIGYFKLGSTVILIFEAPESFKFLVNEGSHIKMGEPLGTNMPS